MPKAIQIKKAIVENYRNCLSNFWGPASHINKMKSLGEYVVSTRSPGVTGNAASLCTLGNFARKHHAFRIFIKRTNGKAGTDVGGIE